MITSTERDHHWQHPWLRLSLLLRSMLWNRWDAETWPVIKPQLAQALELRSRVQREGWFN